MDRPFSRTLKRMTREGRTHTVYMALILVLIYTFSNQSNLVWPLLLLVGTILYTELCFLASRIAGKHHSACDEDCTSPQVVVPTFLST